MYKKIIIPIAATFILSACDGVSVSSQSETAADQNQRLVKASIYDWADEGGGVFNIPSVEFNPTYWGYGSKGYDSGNGIRYNKIDMHRGSSNDSTNTMNIGDDNNPWLFNTEGEQIAKAWESALGWNHVTEERDGGLIAGATTEIKINGTNHKMAYVWSVNSTIGKTSGWVKVSELSPSSTIENILDDTKSDRESILKANGAYGSGLYTEHKVVEAYLSNAMYNYYVTAGRSDDNGAGRARYYYTDVDTQYLSGLMNIPETGSQRYGVAHDIISLNSMFYVASYVASYDVSLYPAGSGSSNSKMTMVFGYSETNAGEKIYSWVNKAALSSTGDTVGGTTSNVVHITKKNSPNYALDGRSGAANFQSIYLWTAYPSVSNQQWIEIDRGNGFYSYQKMGTTHCIDGGGSSTSNRDDVYLYSCSAGNENQHWRKVSTTNGAYQLRKRSNENYAIDGSSGGSNRQNVALWDSGNSSSNLQWYITYID